MLEFLYKLGLDTGNAVASTWIGVLLATSLFVGLARVFPYVTKIQKRPQWTVLRHELKWSALNIATTTIVLKYVSTFLVDIGWLTTDPSPAVWYVVLFEFMLFFFVFDLYFYIVHRTMHIEPLYRWFHLTHHRSTAPNPLSSSSMNPVEGALEGLIIPLFLAAFTVHETSMIFIIPFATLMGLFVHCGHEIAPRWWYRHWATKWVLTPMFHDQHHQYFTCNYGAFTTIWDRVFGTVRGRFDADFDKLRSPKKVDSQQASEPA